MSCFMRSGDNEAWLSVALSCVFCSCSPSRCNTSCSVHTQSFRFHVMVCLLFFLPAGLPGHSHATARLECARDDLSVKILLPSFCESSKRSCLWCLNADFNANDEPQYL